MRSLVACSIVTVMFAAASPARAELTTGTIRVAPNSAGEEMSVVVTGQASGLERRVRTEPRHSALVSGLPPDRYRVEVAGRSAVIVVDVGPLETVELAFVGDRDLRFVDRYRITKGTYFDRHQLSQMPAGSGAGPLADTAAPFVTGDRLDTGGLGLGGMPRVSGEAASWMHASTRAGGFESPHVPGEGDARVLAPMVSAAQAMAIAPEMAPADVASPGIAIDWLPRMPGALGHGAFAADFTAPGMVSSNRTPTAPSIERLDDWKSASGEWGGPITSHTGLFAAAFSGAIRKFERDWPDAAGARLTSALGHLIVTPRPDTQVRLLASVDAAHRPYGEMRPFRAAGIEERSRMFRFHGVWERFRTDGSRLELAAGYERASFDPSGTLGDGVAIDRVFDGVIPDPAARVTVDRVEVRSLVALPEIRRHAVEIGAAFARNGAAASPLATPAVSEWMYGTPARIWTPSTSASDSSRRVYHLAGYITDQWRARPGLTLNLGLRAGVSSGRADGGASIVWPALLPRAAVRWTIPWGSLFGGYARYQADLPLDMTAFGDPAEPVFDVRRASDGVLVARAGRGAAIASIDPSLRAPHTDEVVIGAERPWGKHMSIRVTQVWRRERDIPRSVNTGVPLAGYVPIVLPDRGEDYDGASDDRPLTVYDRLPSSFGADRFELRNGSDVAEYNSTEIAWELRSDRWWSIVGASSYDTWGLGGNTGFKVNERDQAMLGELAENPNAASYARGAVFFDRQYVLKWSTGFDGWRGVRFSTVARYQDGQPFSRLLVVPDLAQGPELVNTYRAGRTRFTFTATADARVEKTFAVGRPRLTLRLDVYNFTNVDNEFEEDPVSGANFRRTTAVQPPRVVRVGFQLAF